MKVKNTKVGLTMLINTGNYENISVKVERDIDVTAEEDYRQIEANQLYQLKNDIEFYLEKIFRCKFNP